MFNGLAAILCVFRFTSVAFTWYVLIGASVTFVRGLGQPHYTARQTSGLARRRGLMSEKRLDLVRGLGAWASAPSLSAP